MITANEIVAFEHGNIRRIAVVNAVSGGQLYHGRRMSKPDECFSILGTISGGGHETQDDRNAKLRQDVRDVRPRSHRLATRPPSRAKRRSSGHRSRRDRPVAERAGLATRSRQPTHIHGYEPTPGRGAGQLCRRSPEPRRRRRHERPLYPGNGNVRATHRRHRGAAARPRRRDRAERAYDGPAATTIGGAIETRYRTIRSPRANPANPVATDPLASALPRISNLFRMGECRQRRATRYSGTARFDELAADIPLSLLCQGRRGSAKSSTPLGCALDLIAGDRA